MAASSPYESAPATVRTPVITQAARAMFADTMKIPDPIIAPTTSIVES